MEARNEHGYLDESQPKPTRDHFVANYTKWLQLKDAYSRTEVSKREKFATEIENYKGIVLRQLMTGIFIEPRPGYLTKVKEMR